jgi:hypothetical protein
MSVEDLSYSSDYDGLEDAYLGEGGVNFSGEAHDGGDSDLDNMFADLAAAQAEGGADGGKRSRKRVGKSKGKSKGKAKSKAKASSKASTSKTGTKTGGKTEPVEAKVKVTKDKSPKPAKEDKEKSEFVHYTMVHADGKETGDYRVKRGKQGPAAAAAKAATRHMKDTGVKNESGKFDVKIRQTTHGQSHNKTFEYTVEYKKVKASPAFEKMTGKKHIYKKKVIAK